MKKIRYFKDEIYKYELCLVYFFLKGSSMSSGVLREKMNTFSKIRHLTYMVFYNIIKNYNSNGFLSKDKNTKREGNKVFYSVTTKLKKKIENELKDIYNDVVFDMRIKNGN